MKDWQPEESGSSGARIGHASFARCARDHQLPVAEEAGDGSTPAPIGMRAVRAHRRPVIVIGGREARGQSRAADSGRPPGDS